MLTGLKYLELFGKKTKALTKGTQQESQTQEHVDTGVCSDLLWEAHNQHSLLSKSPVALEITHDPRSVCAFFGQDGKCLMGACWPCENTSKFKNH